MSARSETASRQTDPAGPGRIGPDDPRYADLAHRGFNKRFRGNPDYVRLVGSTEQVVQAVQEAVRENLQVGVRSGGHCLEGLVADPAVRVLIDTSLMTGVSYDPEMAAFAVEAGTTLGEVYRKLFLGWGVTIPAGESPDLGVGGHVLGGAFGFLCREHGLAADHLYAVEVVVVDEAGAARSVVATREPSSAQAPLTEKNVSMKMALEIIEGALDQCAKDGYKVSVVIVSNDGVVRASLRGDGTAPHTMEFARRKAYTARTRNQTSLEFMKLTESPASAYLKQIPDVVAVGGGVPIRIGNVPIGAVGVSGAPGGEKDEVCANAGIAKVAEQLK